jgi:glutamate dehydrogenase (NAD(P)+)
VGFAEYEGAIYDESGLDLEDVVAHREESGSILDFPGAENVDPTEKALELPCDILIPAALENQITSENVADIDAKIVAEAANGPVTNEAGKRLRDRGVLILPDVYLNAGGVTVSYFEWIKNLSHMRFGRMGKRFEENQNWRILRTIENMLEEEIPEVVYDKVAQGAGEEDLVQSGLEQTMVDAYREIRKRSKKFDTDLRTAAFIDATEKIARSYMERGIFP